MIAENHDSLDRKSIGGLAHQESASDLSLILKALPREKPDMNRCVHLIHSLSLVQTYTIVLCDIKC